MISRKASIIFSHWTMSTLKVRSELEQASLRSANELKIKGFSLFIARSKSEYGFAKNVAREPKASTSWSGTIVNKISSNIFHSEELTSMGGWYSHWCQSQASDCNPRWAEKRLCLSLKGNEHDSRASPSKETTIIYSN